MKQVHLQALEIYPSGETVSGGEKRRHFCREKTPGKFLIFLPNGVLPSPRVKSHMELLPTRVTIHPLHTHSA